MVETLIFECIKSLDKKPLNLVRKLERKIINYRSTVIQYILIILFALATITISNPSTRPDTLNSVSFP